MQLSSGKTKLLRNNIKKDIKHYFHH